MSIDTVSEEILFAATSFLSSTLLEGKRIYETDNLLIFFTGDLIGYEEVPWAEVEENFSKSNFKWFSKLSGFFSFAFFNKKQKQLTLLCDNLAQRPMYYGYLNNNFVFSTDLSTFTTLKNIPDFNVKWLYENIYFNFSVDKTTFLKGVHKLRPVTIVRFDFKSKYIEELQYDNYLKKVSTILIGKEAIDKCLQSFKKIVPKYYSNKKTNLVAISGGYDSRALLSLAPKDTNVITYTYETKGSSYLEVVSSFKKELNLNHKEIFFEEKFREKLPELMYRTVRLSGGGRQPILRSTLLYAYELLFKQNENVATVMGGIGGNLFRGDGGYSPNHSIVSVGVKDFFKSGEIIIRKDTQGKIFKESFHKFENHIQNTLNKIRGRYGNPLEPETIMLFEVYEILPSYFEGEMALASNYFNFRCPYLEFKFTSFNI